MAASHHLALVGAPKICRKAQLFGLDEVGRAASGRYEARSHVSVVHAEPSARYLEADGKYERSGKDRSRLLARFQGFGFALTIDWSWRAATNYRLVPLKERHRHAADHL